VASVYALDAMGHGLNASVISALGVTAMRNARRAGLGLVERFAAANDAIHRQFGCMSKTVVPFATAAALEVDITTGKAVALSAGTRGRTGCARAGPARSSWPPSSRSGCSPTPPTPLSTCSCCPGDRLVLVSDGVLGAVPDGGEHFGEARLEAALLATRAKPPHEAVRHLVGALLDYQQGDLRDDATILLFEWHGARQDGSAV